MTRPTDEEMADAINTPPIPRHRGYPLTISDDPASPPLMDLGGLEVTTEEYEQIRAAVMAEPIKNAKAWEAEHIPHVLDPTASAVRVVMTAVDGTQYGVHLGPLPTEGWNAVQDTLNGREA